MISISTNIQSENGNVILLDDKSSLISRPARVTRYATLDGRCVIVNNGVFDCDRILSINSAVTKEKSAILSNMYTNYSLFIVSCSEGCFLCSFSTFEIKNSTVKITALVKQKEN